LEKIKKNKGGVFKEKNIKDYPKNPFRNKKKFINKKKIKRKRETKSMFNFKISQNKLDKNIRLFEQNKARLIANQPIIKTIQIILKYKQRKFTTIHRINNKDHLILSFYKRILTNI
jgi:hypothetical protein